MIRVLIVDDHSLMRAGIRALFQNSTDIRVVGESGDGHNALELMRELSPDVVLMDISMPGLNGLEVAARARKEMPAHPHSLPLHARGRRIRVARP